MCLKRKAEKQTGLIAIGKDSIAFSLTGLPVFRKRVSDWFVVFLHFVTKQELKEDSKASLYKNTL